MGFEVADDGVSDMEGRSSAWFKDSEGNVIELIEVG
jgi:hypothetical protein